MLTNLWQDVDVFVPGFFVQGLLCLTLLKGSALRILLRMRSVFALGERGVRSLCLAFEILSMYHN